MAAPVRKYNPGFLADDELVASFCVRKTEFEMLVDALRACTGASNPHQIVIGPRGSGKTSLLLRVAAEARRDAALAALCFPVVFAEESYEVAAAGEFWLECLTQLAAQAAPYREDEPDLERTVGELRAVRDDRVLGDRCLGALLDFADRRGQRLLLLVENLNMLFRDMADPDAGWRLRKVLQTEPRIILFASATSRFAEIDHPDRALYDLFRVRTLRPLDTDQCATLWKAVAGRSPPRETVRSLEILTGGSPRLIAIVARFGADRSFRELMADLLDLVDDHTEYFKSHLESLPAQERRVYLALAALWKPATTREIADRTRLAPSPCSAQLARLRERGAVQEAGGSARRKQYYLTERLYNVYYLLRRRNGPDRLVEALVRFMESYYSRRELKDVGARMVNEITGLEAEMLPLHRAVLARLMESLADFRPVEPAAQAAKKLFKTRIGQPDRKRPEETLAGCEEMVLRFGESEDPAVQEWVGKALVNKGFVLNQLLQRPDDAMATCEEVVRRFGASETPVLQETVAGALVNKGNAFGNLQRPDDALTAYDEVVRRFGTSETPALQTWVAQALVYKGGIFDGLQRPDDALAAYDEVVRRFGTSKAPFLQRMVAQALVYKGGASRALRRPDDALVAWDEVVHRFGTSETPALQERVAQALFSKGDTLRTLRRPDDELAIYDEVVRRFGASETPALQERVAQALFSKGDTLRALRRPDDALAAYDEVVHRFGTSETPPLQRMVARALFNKGGTFHALQRPDDALAAYDEVVHRFGTNLEPGLGSALDMARKTLKLGLFDDLPYVELFWARVALKNGDRSACEQEAKSILKSLAELDSRGTPAAWWRLPGGVVPTLMKLTIEIGPERMRELIAGSRAATLLQPLLVALEGELGLEPRVAREVEEVALDLREELSRLQTDHKFNAATTQRLHESSADLRDPVTQDQTQGERV